MRRFIELLAGLIFACVASVALAGTATLSWVNPTAYTDGSALTLASVNVYRATSASGPWTKIGSVAESAAAPLTTWTDATAVAGTTEYYYVTALDAAGNESAPSNTASKAIPPATPNAPTGLQITGATG